MDKAKRAEERERKHEEAQARLARMTEEERTAHEERRKVGRGVGRGGRTWGKNFFWNSGMATTPPAMPMS